MTNIGNKTLYPGAKVVLPYRLSHFSEESFGPNVSQFHPERLLKKKDLTKNRANRPFGGGVQYCSGRFLARCEVLGFLAFVFDRFDLELKSKGKDNGPLPATRPFPRLDVNKPNLGVISPVPGDDIVVSIKPRKRDVL